jgi:malic enzyme
MAADIREASLRYHREGRPGKIEVVASKPLGNQRDLSRAYTPGVAQASLAISEDAAMAAELTVRGNLVGGCGTFGPCADAVRNRAWNSEHERGRGGGRAI